MAERASSFDREKLLHAGGFTWWDRLPATHAGEEVLAQFLMIREYGGCGVLPSGTYHLGLPTTIPDRQRNATELFSELLDERERGAWQSAEQQVSQRETTLIPNTTTGETN